MIEAGRALRGQELSSEGVGDSLGEGEVHSCWEPSESWDRPAFKTCDLSGDTCSLNMTNRRGKRELLAPFQCYLFSRSANVY